VRLRAAIRALEGVSDDVDLMVDEIPRTSFIVLIMLRAKLLISNFTWSSKRSKKITW
jgi:hypothetical protein